MPDGESAQKSVSDLLLDLFVYAPIGLTLDSQELAPDLARRGRQHAANARRIGEFAVKTGLRRIEDVLGTDDPVTETADEVLPPEPVALDRTDQPSPDPEGPSASELAIPDYDLLAASQVVKRLDGLSADELEAVRVYEAATRDRRTILHKIARLQA